MKEKNSVIADQTSLIFWLASTAASLAQHYQAQSEINDKEDLDKKSKTLHLPKKNDNENKSKRSSSDTRDRDTNNPAEGGKNRSSEADNKKIFNQRF